MIRSPSDSWRVGRVACFWMPALQSREPRGFLTGCFTQIPAEKKKKEEWWWGGDKRKAECGTEHRKWYAAQAALSLLLLLRSDHPVCCCLRGQRPVLNGSTGLPGAHCGSISSRHAPARLLRTETAWRWPRCALSAKLQRDFWEVLRLSAAVADFHARVPFHSR